jgi:hypothetical protein
VEYQNWSECLSFYVFGKVADSHAGIIFLSGDIDGQLDVQVRMSWMFRAFGALANDAAKASLAEHVPVIILGRPGLFGSTGDHRYRHTQLEYELVGRAIEELVTRLRVTQVALVGGSGGSSTIMGVISLGSKQGNCIVAASGGYDIANMAERKYQAKGIGISQQQRAQWHRRLFSHHSSLGGIAKEVQRRIFLVGDSTDTFAPFAQQIRYAESLQTAGLRVQVVEAKSPRGDGHSFTYESLVAAAHCLKGEDDNRVVRVFGGILRTP